MDRLKLLCALALSLVLLLPAGCRGGTADADPAEAVRPAGDSQTAETDETDQADETDETDGAAENTDPSSELVWPEGERTVLTVDGEDLSALIYHSDLGYSMTYPVERITLNAWTGGETYGAAQARGTYLAVSRVEASNISEAVSLVKFDQAVEDDPTGYLFGADSYAGVRMIQQAGGLTVEFILAERGGAVFLVERAVFTGGEEVEPTLQAMLDSFTIDE